MSEPSPAAFSSVPGAAWPGAIQPGAAGTVTGTPNDVLFAFGDARWAWTFGAPRNA